MNNLSNKTSITAYRVAKLLLNLLETPMSYKDMFKCLNENENTVYTTEVLNKYLNTLRSLGLKIKKINGKYHLLNFLVQIDLSKNEIDAFNTIEQTILKYGTDKNILSFLEIKKKLIKFLDENSQVGINHFSPQIYNTKLSLLIKQFEKICADGQKIKIEYKGKKINVEPKKIVFFENKVYLECFNILELEVKKFEIDKIKLIEQQPTKNTNIEISNSVIFELTGKLADIYKLKPDEKILSQEDGKLVIKSANEDYDFLARKLIRYKNYCKVIAPLEFKNHFKNFVKKILNQYN